MAIAGASWYAGNAAITFARVASRSDMWRGAMSHWRNTATPIIAEVLERTKGQSEKEIRKALRESYPFGQRRYHPYKIWLDEIQRQRGFKHALGARDPKRLAVKTAELKEAGQLALFE